MKDFLRTTFGKTLLFIICALSITAVLGSGFAAVFYNEYDDAVFYKKTEREVLESFVSDIVFENSIQQLQSIMQSVNMRLDPNYDDFDPQPTGGPPSEENPIKDLDEAALLRLVEDTIISVAETEDFESSEIDFRLTSSTDRELISSKKDASAEKWDYIYFFNIEKSKDGTLYFTNMREAKAEETSGQGLYMKFQAELKEDASANGEISVAKRIVSFAYSLRFAVYWIFALSLLLAILSFVMLMSVSGRRPGTEEIIPGALNFIPFDVLLVLSCLLPLPFFASLEGLNSGSIRERMLVAAFFGLGSLLCVAAFLGLCMSASVRIKQKTLIKKSLCYIILSFIWRLIKGLWRLIVSFFKSIPIVWKTALIVFGISLVELIFIGAGGYGGGVLMTFFFIEKLILIPALIYFALMLKRLKKGGEALAEGDLSYVTDTGKMIGELKKHGENLNSAAIGISKAVDERTKSERMKTELISNVSHDIKTPLTSIINYSMLIGEEETENEKIKEYAEVLRRQAERLSRLSDDIVEASKAQSGNLDVSLAPCDASIFITQTAGEYEDKLKATGLTLITKNPEKELFIMVDGRRMLRIFDNLMSNILKYAQSGTRVYLSLEEKDDKALISFMNISRERLDIDPSELMERFTRGDSARSKEGNGLGLSIAKSMAELQGGKLEISIDGDLFKAELKFPLIRRTEPLKEA